MSILKKVPNSVLWLLADNVFAQKNLINSAKNHGIKKERLIFASRVVPSEYLARYQLADLFLDTFPFNAGTIANDALFMGLPLLTLSGRSFASRYAGSLLTTLGLTDLITTNYKEYERLAVELATDRNKYADIKQSLDENRISGPLFDTARFVADYETVLVTALNEQLPNPDQPLPALSLTTLPTADLNTNLPSQAQQQLEQREPNIYIIAYSPETLVQSQDGFLLLDNLKNPRTDWMEYWPIREYLTANILDEGRLYGFLSPEFTSKTGLAYSGVIDHIAGCDDNVDVITFSPQADMGAFFLNVFEQIDTFDVGFKALAQELFNYIGLDVDLSAMIMDSRHVVYSNYFVARKKFWLEWFNLCEKIFDICEEHDNRLGNDFCTASKYD